MEIEVPDALERVITQLGALPLWVQAIGTLTISVLITLIALEYWPRPSNAPPTFHPSLVPTLGGMVEFAKDPVGLVRKGYDKSGNCFTLRMMGNNLTFMLGPKAHDTFFTSDDDQVSQGDVYRFMTPVFGPGIVYDAPVAVMRQQLRWMSMALHPNAIRSYPPLIQDEAEEYFKTLPDGNYNILDVLSRLIILTASRTLMGPEIRERLVDDVAKLYADLDAGITPLSIFFPYAPIPQHWTRDKAHRALVDLFSRVIRERRERLAGVPADERPNDVLTKFMYSEYKDGSKSTDAECAGLMIALLFAGQHTSSISSTWTTILAMHSSSGDVRDRVLEEVATVFGNAREAGEVDGDRVVLSADRVSQFTLLQSVMKEGIRLNPPLIYLMRKCRVPIQCGPYTVPKGDIIFASPAVSHRLPAPDGSFEEPDKFNPDRYADEGGTGTRSKDRVAKRYIGFGAGRHSCMGEPFGYLQVTTIVATLLRHFEVECLDALPKSSYHAMVVGPEHDKCHVRLTRRKVPLGN